MTEPDQIRQEIERTQRTLSTDVDALTEKVTPGRIVERRVGRLRDAVHRAKDTVMGTTTDYAAKLGDKAGSVASTTQEGTSSMASEAVNQMSSAAEAIGEAPEAIRRSTRGNPLAAGVIAFGAGWLISSLLPASDPERRLAGKATDVAREHVQPAARQVAEEMKDNLREPVKQAVESIKSEAAGSASTVTDEAHAATDDVTERAQKAQHNLRSPSSE
ncbi:DUF3618 domain-containing protein [Amycolatopsis regifaucium]|uniref:DUF3618 domain-containing protein n=1 Tax=Amycolatopsis regifaucium TaxID=546365 RepID=A0A154MY45_9PSEU|nr:DUF3618 domain-containing protein [Amycolatopsis regifaucium]KZB88379.1 hypothetical protein AVL48_20780 [Amycolatopsis regifaucium]OKA11490.1 hypothetical protein ATP06_0201175 [Amycolatopsis regifaucium]SFH40382.1 Protein of unknown function [Amycolatopsis regifaucium]